MEKLKKGSSVPLYKQLFEVIEQQISDGELKEGQQLMTEAELSAEYGVSRITVRKALELLVEDGILVKRQGVGAFVAERKMHRRVEGIMGFTQNCAAEGKKAGAVLLAAELAEPTVKDIENLQIKSNEKVIRHRQAAPQRRCAGDPGGGPLFTEICVFDGAGSHHLHLPDAGGPGHQPGTQHHGGRDLLC